jgi:hypothetical protein
LGREAENGILTPISRTVAITVGGRNVDITISYCHRPESAVLIAQELFYPDNLPPVDGESLERLSPEICHK